jgi:hypothetical protein
MMRLIYATITRSNLPVRRSNHPVYKPLRCAERTWAWRFRTVGAFGAGLNLFNLAAK